MQEAQRANKWEKANVILTFATTIIVAFVGWALTVQQQAGADQLAKVTLLATLTENLWSSGPEQAFAIRAYSAIAPKNAELVLAPLNSDQIQDPSLRNLLNAATRKAAERLFDMDGDIRQLAYESLYSGGNFKRSAKYVVEAVLSADQRWCINASEGYYLAMRLLSHDQIVGALNVLPQESRVDKTKLKTAFEIAKSNGPVTRSMIERFREVNKTIDASYLPEAADPSQQDRDNRPWKLSYLGYHLGVCGS
jgi:hypothetical protein